MILTKVSKVGKVTMIGIMITMASLVLTSPLLGSLVPKQLDGPSIPAIAGYKEALDYGISAILVEPEPKVIHMKRGETVEVTFWFSYLKGSKGVYPSITILLDLPPLNKRKMGSFIGPSSVTNQYGDEYIQEKLKKGEMIPGMVDLYSLVYSPISSITLKPGEKKAVKMYVAIPGSFPTEFVSEEWPVLITPYYELEENLSDVMADPISLEIFVVE